MNVDRRVISGELHYPRIPREYWRHRLRMARAMGLDTISTYVFWNRHEPEPGTFDFSGENDVAAFIREAQSEGLDVILRPGPYVCAEWDFGGLPAWLLREEVPVRALHDAYMTPVRAWLRRLGQEVALLQRAFGGPIIAVQLENEYGAFGKDPAYLRTLYAALADAGFGCSPLFTIDQPADLAAGALDELPIAATFAPGNPAREFEAVRALRSQARLLCGEYWAGWFDHWGEPHHRLDPAQQARDLQWMLRESCSVNIYMFHGGTNFGFWNGANSSQSRPYQPTTTSYDYDAALDEAGRPTPKYFLFRRVIASETRAEPPAVPAPPRTIDVPPFTLAESCPLLGSDLVEPVVRQTPLPMELLGQNLGFVLYRTILEHAVEGNLEIDELRDYAVVAVDGKVVAHLERRRSESRAAIRMTPPGTVLDILVENCGRINYGPHLPFERKGITRAVRLNGRELRGWQMFALPLHDVTGLEFSRKVACAPAFYRGSMHVQDPADTFLEVSALGKGVVWVNGRNLGRCWRIGPQRTLYVPGVWLHAGVNEVVALDLFAHADSPVLRGLQEPVTIEPEEL